MIGGPTTLTVLQFGSNVAFVTLQTDQDPHWTNAALPAPSLEGQVAQGPLNSSLNSSHGRNLSIYLQRLLYLVKNHRHVVLNHEAVTIIAHTWWGLYPGRTINVTLWM